MKYSIRQNRWGNWYGYLGTTKVMSFFGYISTTEQQKRAEHWLARMTAAQERYAKMTCSRSKRAGDALAERYDVKIVKFRGDSDLKMFTFMGGKVRAYRYAEHQFAIATDTHMIILPMKAARALGHFLIHHAKELP